jgi:SAM-dependent methyltransferase
VNDEAGDMPIRDIDQTTPANARVWDYWLGGKDNFEVDRQVGRAVAERFPLIPAVARADRAFLQRVVAFLTREAGIRQFLDVGTGLPAANNTHEVAQEIAADARVVYVDHDPIVLAHARVLLGGTSQGRTAYIDADAHQPEEILTQARKTLDFSQPIALLMLGLLNFIPNDADAEHTATVLIDSVAPGSYLAITHPTYELNGGGNLAAMQFWNENSPNQRIVARTGDEILRFFDGLELLEPNPDSPQRDPRSRLVSCTQWRPDPVHVGETQMLPQYGGVAVKR